MSCNYHDGDEPLFVNDKISVFIDSHGNITIFENEYDNILGDFKLNFCPKCGESFVKF
jgi:hypothetical protein